MFIDESKDGIRVLQAGELVRLRTERGWRREDVAVRAGLAMSTVAALERGDRPAYLNTVERLADVFGVEVEDLVAA